MHSALQKLIKHRNLLEESFIFSLCFHFYGGVGWGWGEGGGIAKQHLHFKPGRIWGIFQRYSLFVSQVGQAKGCTELVLLRSMKGHCVRATSSFHTLLTNNLQEAVLISSLLPKRPLLLKHKIPYVVHMYLSLFAVRQGRALAEQRGVYRRSAVSHCLRRGKLVHSL